MHLRYDDDFLETAVSLCATGWRHGDVDGLSPARRSSAGQSGVAIETPSDPTPRSPHVARFHRAREKLYAIADPDERDAAFFKLHLEWFREWGLEKCLTDPLDEFPLLRGALNVLAFRKAGGRNDEGADLYVHASGTRNAVVALRPQRLGRKAALGAFLRHELTHLQDMVDPAFAYAAEIPSASGSLSQQRLARERYRLLWDITIDGRLSRSGCNSMATREERWAEFARAFPFWTESKQRTVFDSLWVCQTPTHRAIAEFAGDPRELRSAAGPQPGAACPLCDFPTFDWAEADSLTPEARALIVADFPNWTPDQGICGRCREAYLVAASPRERAEWHDGSLAAATSTMTS